MAIDRTYDVEAEQAANLPEAFPYSCPPTELNVSYGPHERHNFDLWVAQGTGPRPLFISIHGGGFGGGYKLVKGDILQACLKAGISVVALTYRLTPEVQAPAAFYDCARALQFIRANADRWNIDKNRIAAFGISAGAGIALWLACKDDMADSSSSDPVARESTRLLCTTTLNAQTSYDPRFIRAHVPGDAYRHPALVKLFAMSLDDPDNAPDSAKAIFEEVSPINYVTSDDPPAQMLYRDLDDRIAPLTDTSKGIHHPIFGLEMKKRLEAVGVPCEVVTGIRPGDPSLCRHVMRYIWQYMSKAVFERVQSLLQQKGIVFDVLRHAPVYTSQEAADIRGTPLASGAKALVCKGDDRFVMFVLPADRKLDSKAVRLHLGWKKLRFADKQEVLELTGLEPGSIPPLGSLFGLPTYCDSALGENPTINFNAGDHCISVSMTYDDYIRVESPKLGKFGSASL